METFAIVNDRAGARREFISALESRTHKEFLRDWAMGWVLDIAIDNVLKRDLPEEEQFTAIFRVWRDKCLELASLVLKVDNDTHLYGGIDLTKISPEICQRWLVRFANLSEELGIK